MFVTYLSESSQLCIVLHPQPLLHHSKAGQIKTKIHSRPGTNLIGLGFHLTRAIFTFLPATSASTIFSILNGVQSLCFIHSELDLCAVIGWGKAPTPHPETSRVNQNAGYRQRAGALLTQSPPFLSFKQTEPN